MSWFHNMYHTYLLIEPGADIAAIEERVNRWAHVRMAEDAELMLGVSYDELAKRFSEYGFTLQPLESVHLNSRLQYELGENGDGRYLSLFELIALAILLVSLANFTNLATARSSTRALEIGVRKTLGADRFALLKQFFVESVSLSIIATLPAGAIVSVALPFFNEFVERPLAYEPLTDWRHALLTLALAVLAGVVAGLYPALALSAFKPADALRGGVAVGRKRSYFRSALVVGQFTVSIALIAAAFGAFSQADYLREKDLGFPKDRLLVIQKTDDLTDKQNQFKREIVALPNVQSATKLNGVPGHTFPGWAWRLARYEDYERAGVRDIADSLVAELGSKFSDRDRSVVTFWVALADEDFLETFGVRLHEGRFIEPGSARDSLQIVVNRTAAAAFGDEFGVGERLVPPGAPKETGPPHEVVGVVEDFHFESLYEPIRPMIIGFGRHSIHGKVIVARLGKGDAEETISHIEEIWNRLQDKQRFEYYFFNEEFTRLHRAELRLGVIAGLFSVLAIFVASLGLLGLAAYSAERRSKEIGVRKALGASATALVARLVGEYVVWTLVATIIAAPLSYYAFERWLSQFPNHIALSPLPFLVAAGVALVIAVTVVVSQALRAAPENPVNSLRYE